MKLLFACLLSLVMVSVAVAQDSATAPPPVAVRAEARDHAWWMPRHEQKLKQKKEMGQVDLLMIGDSITHSWENAGKQVWEKLYEPRKALNLGFSGDRTENVLWRLRHGAIEDISPKLAVVMIGTNNTGHRFDKAEDTAAGVEAIVDELRKQLPETKVLLLGIFPRDATAQGKNRQRNVEINQHIAKLADGQHVYYLDLSDTFLDDDGTLPKSIMPDLLHPNSQGYQLWADTMEPTIAKLMGEK